MAKSTILNWKFFHLKLFYTYMVKHVPYFLI